MWSTKSVGDRAVVLLDREGNTVDRLGEGRHGFEIMAVVVSITPVWQHDNKLVAKAVIDKHEGMFIIRGHGFHFLSMADMKTYGVVNEDQRRILNNAVSERVTMHQNSQYMMPGEAVIDRGKSTAIVTAINLEALQEVTSEGNKPWQS